MAEWPKAADSKSVIPSDRDRGFESPSLLHILVITMPSALYLKKTVLSSPLGDLVALADEQYLYFLQFLDNSRLDHELKRFSRARNAEIIPGETEITRILERELQAYCSGTIKRFSVPLFFSGTLFQKRVWSALQTIPYGTTVSYADIACRIEKPSACRAVANANRANTIAILIPCHRVIKADGDLCGYNGGVERKRWLLEHERRYSCKLFET